MASNNYQVYNFLFTSTSDDVVLIDCTQILDSACKKEQYQENVGWRNT